LDGKLKGKRARDTYYCCLNETLSGVAVLREGIEAVKVFLCGEVYIVWLVSQMPASVPMETIFNIIQSFS
jgi:hypothetical protein